MNCALIYPSKNEQQTETNNRGGITMVKYSRAIIFILLVYSISLAMPVYAEWTPPADRVPAGGMWSPGIPGGIPNRTIIYSTLSPTGDSTDRTSDIQNALNACGTNEVVYLNAGTYYVSGTIYIPSNKVLRGAGMGQTYLRKTGTGKGIVHFGGGPSWGGAGNWIFDEWEELTGGWSKDSTAVTVADSSGYAANQLVIVAQGDGDNPDVRDDGVAGSGPAHWDKMYATADWPPNDWGSVGQANLISSVNGNTINLTRPLYYDNFSSSYTVSIGRTSVACRNSGIEDLTIYREQAAADQGNSENNGAVLFGRAVYCWAKNVELDTISGPGVNFAWAFGCVMHGCTISKVWSYYSGGGGYQVTVKHYSADILIENNIIHQGTPNIHIQPCAGNVFAYNFIDVAVTNGGTDWAVYNVGGHAHLSYMLLFEGNNISIMENDYTHGNSIQWFHLRNHYDAIQTEWEPPLNSSMAYNNRSAIDFDSYAFEWTVVGNVLGRSGDTYAAYQSEAHGGSAVIYRQPNDVLDTLIRHGNYDYHDNEVKWGLEGDSRADLQGTSSDHDIPDSLYLTSRPSWWYDQGDGRPWPCIGPDIPGYVIDIPAKDRFEGQMYGDEPPIASPPNPPTNLMIISAD
jgi:hypothetical protein